MVESNQIGDVKRMHILSLILNFKNLCKDSLFEIGLEYLEHDEKGLLV